jgi:hypothetical protein
MVVYAKYRLLEGKKRFQWLEENALATAPSSPLLRYVSIFPIQRVILRERDR